MPDFDTRKPQEPDRPGRLHMFVVSSKQDIAADGRWIARTMMRHWRLGLSVSCLTVLGVIIIPWAVKAQLAYKLDQGIQVKPTPAYALSESAESESGVYACEDDALDGLDYGYDCIVVQTKATDAATLASIINEASYGSEGLQLEFLRRGEFQATGYCFASKNAAISELRQELYWADLLGTTGHCYIAVYKPYEEPPPKIL
jgi:hypothetical protein